MPICLATRAAVGGISCIKPSAAAGERARVSNKLSWRISAKHEMRIEAALLCFLLDQFPIGQRITVTISLALRNGQLIGET